MKNGFYMNGKTETYPNTYPYLGSTLFPLRFCKHRWIENVPVAERALQMWPNVITYIKSVASGKLKDPKTKSFEYLKSAYMDPLLI